MAVAGKILGINGEKNEVQYHKSTNFILIDTPDLLC